MTQYPRRRVSPFVRWTCFAIVAALMIAVAIGG
jgi:hypothetical protein